MTGMILINLQNAFDTIDHDILSEKNALLGFLQSSNTDHTLQTGCFGSMQVMSFHPQVNCPVAHS